jgi:hypothetical protein
MCEPVCVVGVFVCVVGVFVCVVVVFVCVVGVLFVWILFLNMCV